MAQLRLLCLLLLHVHIVQGTSIWNPCTSEALRQKQLYHPYPQDNGSYVQCDEWGTPMIRRCPPLQVWNAEYVTCVHPTWRTSGFGETVLMPDSQTVSSNTTGSSQDIHNNEINPTADSGRRYLSGAASAMQAYFAAARASDAGVSYGQGQLQQQQPLQSVSGGMQTQNIHASGNVANAGQGDYPSQHQQLTYTSTANKGNNDPMQSSAESPQQTAADSAVWKYVNEATESAKPVNSSQVGYYRTNWMSKWKGSSQMSQAVGTNDGVSRDSSYMNPCDRPNVRYIAHESNPNLYYECVGLTAVKRMCMKDEVWAQERNQCVTSTYNASLNHCAEHISSQNVGTPVTIPFPGDATKYIICFDSNRFETRSCQAGQKWAEQSQQCVLAESSVPSASPAGGPDQTRPNICTVSSSGPAASFYHSYPPDSSRFLQCDDFGNVYLRYCGHSKVWKDELKTCVGGATLESILSSSTSHGQPPNNVNGNGVSAVSGGSTGSSPPVLAAGNESSLVSNKLTEPSMSGPSGTLPGVNSTQSAGPAGQHDGVNMQTIIVAEIFRIVCPRGYRYIIESGVCSLNQTNSRLWPTGSSTNSDIKCPPNFEWNVELHLCVRRFSAGGTELVGNITSLSSNSSTSTVVAQSTTGNITHGNETSFGSSFAAQELPSLPVEANPCGLGNNGVLSGFYFPFPDNAAFFVQCDENGIAFVQACPSGLVWSKNLVTCIHQQAFSEGNSTLSNTPIPNSTVSTNAASYTYETNAWSTAKSQYYAK